MTPVVVILIIIAVLAAFLLLYLWRKFMVSSYERRCVDTLHEEVAARFRQLDAEVRRSLRAGMETSFSPLGAAGTEASEAIRQLLAEITKTVLEDPSTTDPERIRDNLLADDHLLRYCRARLLEIYGDVARLVQGPTGSLFATHRDSGDCDAPKAGCLYRILFVTRDWQIKKFDKTRRGYYYSLAHRLCCGRDRVLTDGQQSDDETELVDDDFHIDDNLAASQHGVPTTKYLNTGLILKCKFAEVTRHARDLVLVERGGSVAVAPSASMHSAEETSRLLERCFRHTSSQRDLPLVSHQQDSEYFAAGELRDALFIFMHNTLRILSTTSDFASNRPCTQLLVMFDEEVKRWTVDVQCYLARTVMNAWRERCLLRCAQLLQVDVDRAAARGETDVGSSGADSGGLSLDADHSHAPQAEVVAATFWAKQLSDWEQVCLHPEFESVPQDSLTQCCGYCMPQYVELEASYSHDPAKVHHALLGSLRSAVVESLIQEEDKIAARKETAKLRRNVLRLLLPAAHDTAAKRQGEGAESPRPPPASADDPSSTAFGDEHPPEPPARVDVSNELRDEAVPYSPRESDTNSPMSVYAQSVDDVTRDSFFDVERLVTQAISRVEADVAERCFLRRRPAAAEVVTAVTQQVLNTQKDALASAAAQLAVMRRIYRAVRHLCQVGQALHKERAPVQPVHDAVEELRDMLVEAREIKKRMPSGFDCNFLSHRISGGDADPVTGKPSLAFPWQHVLVPHNFYADLLQKPKVTLQFIYD